MAEYTLKVRRFQPEPEDGVAAGPYWEEFDVELEDTLSVLDQLIAGADESGAAVASHGIHAGDRVTVRASGAVA